MELLCIQSQEHDKLPLAELNAVIECEDMELDISKITEGLILLKDISDENSDKYYQTLGLKCIMDGFCPNYALALKDLNV